MAGPSMPSRPLVVVVDDTLPVRLLVSRALSEAGFDVLSAPDGAAAATLMLASNRRPIWSSPSECPP
jgi:CheY-like chemotaxis protein